MWNLHVLSVYEFVFSSGLKKAMQLVFLPCHGDNNVLPVFFPCYLDLRKQRFPETTVLDLMSLDTVAATASSVSVYRCIFYSFVHIL